MSAPAAGYGRLTLRPDGPAEGGRVGGLVTWPADRPLLADVVPVFDRLSVRVADAVAVSGDDGAPATHLELLLPPEAAGSRRCPARSSPWPRPGPGSPSSTAFPA